jgi:hypothetical protein
MYLAAILMANDDIWVNQLWHMQPRHYCCSASSPYLIQGCDYVGAAVGCAGITAVAAALWVTGRVGCLRAHIVRRSLDAVAQPASRAAQMNVAGSANVLAVLEASAILATATLQVGNVWHLCAAALLALNLCAVQHAATAETA